MITALAARYRRLIQMLFWLAFLFASVMALLPKPPRIESFNMGDKWEHALAFAVLTLLAQLGFGPQGRWRIAERLAFFGAMIEVAQTIAVLHRDADIRDWLVDTWVVVLVTFLCVLADRWQART